FCALAYSVRERIEHLLSLFFLRRIHAGVGTAEMKLRLRVLFATDLIRLLHRREHLALVAFNLSEIKCKQVHIVDVITGLFRGLDIVRTLPQNIARFFVQAEYLVRVSQSYVKWRHAWLMLDSVCGRLERLLRLISRPV